MILVKDLLGHRIVYYWLDGADKVSPELASLALAEEWYIKYNHSLYDGPERRSSHIDRRKLYTKRDKERNTELLPTNPVGRRITDRHVQVSLDLAKQKMLDLAEAMKRHKDD